MQSTVTVTQTAPPSANPGSSFTVEVTINKGATTGFAKYQADLPQGFTAKEGEKNGATVLSSGNAIKFIWASLPGDQTLKISYTVTVDPSVSGNQNIGGRFAYVVDNNKQGADANPLTIAIAGSGAVASTTPTTTVTPTSAGTDPNATNATTSSGANPVATNSVTPTSTGTDPNATNATTSSGTNPVATNTVTPTSTGNNPTSTASSGTNPVANGNGNGNGSSATPAPSVGGVYATRSLSAGSVAPGGSLTVSVTIHKGALSGFARLEEVMPAGCTPSGGDLKTGSFTLVDNKMKIVWMNLPADSVYTVTYNVNVGASVSGDQSITGTFSFLSNGGTAKYPINATTFSITGSGAIAVQQTGGNQ
ncbi:MAG TPA: hypothetical protein VNY36_03555, partial [Bacteroidia bacterium]|nr:hypothetical protein [Bacteroidia bacterium]